MAERQPFDPKTTTLTNLALDEIMPRVSGNAWKIICFALRKTQGWADQTSPTGRKQSDVIALSQFMTGCGIVKNTAMTAINECLAAGYLVRIPDGRSYRYSLNLAFIMPETGARIAPMEDGDRREIRADEEKDRREICTPIGAKIAPIAPKIGAKIEHTNTNTTNTNNTKEHARPLTTADLTTPYLVQSTRPIDHETVPTRENLHALYQAFQRATGQKESAVLPSGSALFALRQLNDEGYPVPDVETYVRILKAGWWSGKMLPLTKVAEGIGQWIADGRPGVGGVDGHPRTETKRVLGDDGQVREVEVRL